VRAVAPATNNSISRHYLPQLNRLLRMQKAYTKTRYLGQPLTLSVRSIFARAVFNRGVDATVARGQTSIINRAADRFKN